MRSLFSTTNLKSGLLAFGLAAAVSIPSFAAPLTMPSPAVPQNTALPGITQVRASWAGGGGHGGAIWRHHGGWHGGGWHGGGGGAARRKELPGYGSPAGIASPRGRPECIIPARTNRPGRGRRTVVGFPSEAAP